MGKIVEKLTRKLGRAPTSEEIEEAKRKAAQKKEAARAQAAAQPAEAGGSSSALVPAAAAASAGKRAADDAGAPAAAKRPRGRPKKGSQGPSESPEFIAALLATVEKIEEAAKVPKMIAQILRSATGQGSGELDYNAMVRDVLKRSNECTQLVEEAAQLILTREQDAQQ